MKDSQQKIVFIVYIFFEIDLLNVYPRALITIDWVVAIVQMILVGCIMEGR